MADTKLFLIIVSFLALATIVTGVILLSYNSWNLDTNQDGIPDGKDLYEAGCPPGSFYCSNIASSIAIMDINYTQVCDTNSSYINMVRGGLGGGLIPFFNTAPYWRCRDGVGWISESGEFGLTPPASFLLYKNIQTVGETYKNTYVINNSVKKDFGIVIRWKQWDEVMYVAVYPKGLSLNGATEQYTYNSGNYDLFTHPILTIHTEYTPTTHALKFNITESGVGFEITAIPSAPLAPNFMTSEIYAGIGTKDAGVNLRSISTYIISTESKDYKTITLDFIDLLYQLITFQPSTGVPWFIVVIFVYIPGLVILAYLIELVILPLLAIIVPDWL